MTWDYQFYRTGRDRESSALGEKTENREDSEEECLDFRALKTLSLSKFFFSRTNIWGEKVSETHRYIFLCPTHSLSLSIYEDLSELKPRVLRRLSLCSTSSVRIGSRFLLHHHLRFPVF